MRRALWILLRWPFRKWLHRRCLRRIAAWRNRHAPNYTQVVSGAFEIKPGAVWAVDDPRDVKYMAVMHKHNLMRSALYASKVEWLEDGSKVTSLVPATQHVQINSNPYALTNPTEGDKHVA